MTSSELLGFGLDHHHRIRGAGDDQVELAFLDLRLGRVEDIFAVEVADARGADRAHEGDAGDGERCGRGDHRQDVGLVLAVVGEHLGDAQDLVIEALGEQRADRPVDQAAGQRFLFGGAALALEEAARDAPGGREFFLVVDGQREEVLARLDRLGGGDRAEDDGFAKGRQDGAVGLTGNAARFELQGLSAELDFHGFDIKHVISLRPRPNADAGQLWQTVRPASGAGPNLPLRLTAELRSGPKCEERHWGALRKFVTCGGPAC